MTGQPLIEKLLRRAARELRLRRAESWAWRGAFWGALAATAVMAAKSWLGDEALLVAVLVFVLALVVGAIAGAVRRVAPLDSARLTDRALDLQDRLATAVELSRNPHRTPLTEALLADTAQHLEGLASKSVVPLKRPRESRWLALPVLAATALFLAPPLPHPGSWLSESFGSEPRSRDGRGPSPLEELARLFGAEFRKQNPFAPRENEARTQAAKAPAAGESAQFKDRSLDKRSSDFSSFVNKGDDRLRLLERTDRLPDLQSDFASSQYRLMLRRAQELSSGKGANQVSTAKLGQILKEMERLGRKGGEWGDDAREGLEALEHGETEEAMEAMESALGKLRQMEERQRSSRLLRGGRDRQQEQADGRSADGGSARNDEDRRGSYSLAQSRGAEKGKPSTRLRSTPYDSGVQGQRRGRMPAVETQMTSRPGGSGIQLQALGEIGQYQRMMEDAIAREQVPRAYHDQIRDYFKSLNER